MTVKQRDTTPEEDQLVAELRELTKRAYPESGGMSVSYFPTTDTLRFGEMGPHLLIGFSSHDRLVMHGSPFVLLAAKAALWIMAQQHERVEDRRT